METIISCPESIALKVLITLCQDRLVLNKAVIHVNSLNKATQDFQDAHKICVNCDEEFNLAENHDKACNYHTGLLLKSVC